MIKVACWMSFWTLRDQAKNHRRLRRASVITVDDILKATAQEYGVSADQYKGFRSSAGGRDIGAYHCRCYTTAPLADHSERTGQGHPDSASDMIKRAKKMLENNPAVKRRMNQIEKRLGLKPETRV